MFTLARCWVNYYFCITMLYCNNYFLGGHAMKVTIKLDDEDKKLLKDCITNTQPTEEEPLSETEEDKEEQTKATISIIFLRLGFLLAFICGLIGTIIVAYGLPPTWVCYVLFFCAIGSFICLTIGAIAMPNKNSEGLPFTLWTTTDDG